VTLQLIPHGPWLTKLQQLYDAVCVRHGVMVVGPAASGKSAMMTVLASALSEHTKRVHRIVAMNPKAITPQDMFGEADRRVGLRFNNLRVSSLTCVFGAGCEQAEWGVDKRRVCCVVGKVQQTSSVFQHVVGL
jgi:energy-coupling factor transporter ATP-binding protein EcfA2